MTWQQLSHFQQCASFPPLPGSTEGDGNSGGGSGRCDVFGSLHPRTISMSVLVVVEMFNALNNLSEDASLLQVWMYVRTGRCVKVHEWFEWYRYSYSWRFANVHP